MNDHKAKIAAEIKAAEDHLAALRAEFEMNKPTSRDWRDVYRWMQEQGVRFACRQKLSGDWFADYMDFTSDQENYRIDLSQTPTENWREIYRTAQEFGVVFSWAYEQIPRRYSIKQAFGEYQLAAAKREEPKPKTRQVKMLAWFDGIALLWKSTECAMSPNWKRVPSEDKIIEVEE